jgi:cell wall assembly regulator SMI1
MSEPSPGISLSEVGDQILGQLRGLSRTYVLERLQPGLDKAQLTAEFAALGLDPPELLVELYAWRNGTAITPSDVLDDIHFFPGFYFPSFEHASADYMAFKDDQRWSESWFPVFANGGGDFYAVDCAHSQTRGAVIGFLLDEPEQLVEHLDLLTMFRAIQQAYEAGVYFTADDYLEADDEAFIEIARRLNPGLMAWQ